MPTVSCAPFHRVPEHDDEAGVGLQGVHKVLDEEGRLPAGGGVVVKVHPGVVVPHGGGTGFACQTQKWTDVNFGRANVLMEKASSKEFVVTDSIGNHVNVPYHPRWWFGVLR